MNRRQSIIRLNETIQEYEESPQDLLVTELETIHLAWRDVALRFYPPKPSLFKRILSSRSTKAWKLARESPKTVLEGVLGEVRPGELVGIMGESGAGKTKLLQLLGGRLSAGTVSGNVFVNGKQRDFKEYADFVSCVDVDDLHDPELTVEQIVRFAVMMKDLHAVQKLSPEACNRAVKKLLKAVELTPKQGTKSMYLSSGELRRLSITVELAARRRLLMIDEPTGGLDAATAFDITRMLQKMAQTYQLSIILVVHQPRESILKLFDRLILLARGHPVYYGSLDETLEHFETVLGGKPGERENPADFIMDMISKDRLSTATMEMSEMRYQKLRREWEVISADLKKYRLSKYVPNVQRNSIESVVTLLKPTVRPRMIKSAPWSEFKLLIWRYWLTERQCLRSNIIYFSWFTLLALFHGFLYFQLTLNDFGGYQSRMGLLLNMIGVQMTILTGQFAAEFSEGLQMVRKERASKVYIWYSAFFAKVLVMAPLRFITITVFGVIVYYLAGLRTDSFVPFLVFIGFNWLILLCMMFLSIIFAVSGIPLLPTYCGIYFFALCGIPVRIPDITPILSWIRFLSPAYFTLQGLVQNECASLVFGEVEGLTYIEDFAMNEISVMWAAAGLMITAAGYLCISLAGFYHATRPPRL